MSHKSLVVWLNGPFGVGRTTVACGLAERLNARIFDPESVGIFRRIFLRAARPPNDFQEVSAWRRLTRWLLKMHLLVSRRPVVVPMTLVNEAYFEEVIGALRAGGVEVRHFALVASAAAVRGRLKERGTVAAWAEKQVERCLAALSSPLFKEHIDTEHTSADEVIERLLERLGRSSMS
ncbi:MAG: AAA family ATPase [Myxococcaceae bacterium]